MRQGYNVVALTDWFGTMLEQVAFEPYGNVLSAESFGSHAVNRVGHQGLFFERYDGSYTQPSIAANIAGLYYVRNRFYDPLNGRWTSRDPNETGIPLLTALAMNGQAMSIVFGTFDARMLYTDGMSLYQYVQSNPVNGRDPLGLGPYEFEDIMMELYAQGGAAVDGLLSFFNKSLDWFRFTIDVVTSLLPGTATIEAVSDAFSGNGGAGGIGMGLAMDFAPVGKFIGKANTARSRYTRLAGRAMKAGAEHLQHVGKIGPILKCESSLKDTIMPSRLITFWKRGF